ncbi:coiled-coil domain-containing protein 136 isoform X2 [Eleginops maclovinus]|uniref:coiled-coil domain-containing protein 136 isoform X2 n=1 Tax=Eleginops maclovinus TaxID=56733 RepID=UPI0030805B48
MDSFRLPPVIEEVLDPSDELCELKETRPIMLGETLTAKERESLEEKEEEKEVMEEKMEEEEEEEEDDEELRSQVFQLMMELDDSREVSQRQEESVLELQGLLEDERLASAHQAESFTRQIQRLQGDLRLAQEEMDRLEEEKESELQDLQDELRLAQEEVMLLQAAAEEAAAERENDIASLQEELQRLRAEISRRQQQKSGDLKLKGELVSLSDERRFLSSDNKDLSGKVEKLQGDTCDEGVYLAVSDCEQVKADAYITLSEAADRKQEDRPSEDPEKICSSEISAVKIQLRHAEETALKVQTQCEGLKNDLEDLQRLYDSSRSERAVLEVELQRCKAELQKLVDRKAQRSDAEGWSLAVAVVAVAAVLVLVVPSFSRA